MESAEELPSVEIVQRNNKGFDIVSVKKFLPLERGIVHGEHHLSQLNDVGVSNAKSHLLFLLYENLVGAVIFGDELLQLTSNPTTVKSHTTVHIAK